MTKPPFELLVFDWDGTLMDSVAAIVGCMQQAASDLALGPVSEERVRGFVGLGLDEALSAIGLGDDPALSERLVERYRHHWFATFRERPVLYAGVPQLLATLAAQGYKLAVATGKSRRGLDRDLETTGLAGRFQATRTADEAFGKPHPKMLLDVIEHVGAAPATTLMIGDTTYDLDMASNAGATAVAIDSGSQRRDQLINAKPLDCLAHICDLLPWLEARRLSA